MISFEHGIIASLPDALLQSFWTFCASGITLHTCAGSSSQSEVLKKALNAIWLCRFVNERLHTIQQRVLVLASDQDWLIPSREEGRRLKQKLPRCRLKVWFLKFSSHLCNIWPTDLLKIGSNNHGSVKMGSRASEAKCPKPPWSVFVKCWWTLVFERFSYLDYYDILQLSISGCVAIHGNMLKSKVLALYCSVMNSEVQAGWATSRSFDDQIPEILWYTRDVLPKKQLSIFLMPGTRLEQRTLSSKGQLGWKCTVHSDFSQWLITSLVHSRYFMHVIHSHEEVRLLSQFAHWVLETDKQTNQKPYLKLKIL